MCATGFHTGALNVLEDERKKWSGLWQVDGSIRPRSWKDQGVPVLPALTSNDIRAVARLFRVGTSNIEGMGPRHIGLLSEDALCVLAMMCRI